MERQMISRTAKQGAVAKIHVFRPREHLVLSFCRHQFVSLCTVSKWIRDFGQQKVWRRRGMVLKSTSHEDPAESSRVTASLVDRERERTVQRLSISFEIREE